MAICSSGDRHCFALCCLKMSVFSLQFISPALLKDIIRSCVGEGIAIRVRLQCVNDRHAFYTKYPFRNAGTSSSVSKRATGTLLFRSCLKLPVFGASEALYMCRTLLTYMTSADREKITESSKTIECVPCSIFWDL